MSTKISDLDTLSSPSGSEVLNYILGSTDRIITLNQLANTITANNIMYYVKRTLSISELEDLHNTAIEVIPAAGANTIICPCVTLYHTTEGTEYDTFTDEIVYIYNTGSTTNAFQTAIHNGMLTWFMQGVSVTNYTYVENPQEALVNKGFEVFNIGGALENGTQTADLHIWYYIFDV